MDKKTKRLFYLEYTFLFLLIAGLIIYYYYSQGRTMVDEGGDGFRQHIRALLYYSEFLRKTFSGFLQGNFTIPQWDLAIGEGSDILMTMHYYCMGDVFAFFSFLCPKEFIYLYYDGSTILKMYCAGLAFSTLCFYKKKGNICSILTGALLYAFCSFSMISMRGHVIFISAAVYLPLIILGVEKIICHDQPYLLPVAVMLSALSNVYFFYMNVITTIIYVAVRLIFSRESIADRAKVLLKIACYSVLGVLMACVIFLPMASALVKSSRLESDFGYGLFFSLAEYLDYYNHLTFRGTYFGDFFIYWPIAFVYLFVKRKDPNLITLLILAFLFVGLPFLSSIYNAMTYPTNRWCYAISMLVSYIYADVFEEARDSNQLLPVNLIVCILYYGSCMLLDKTDWKLHLLFLLASVFVLLFIRFVRSERICSLMYVGVTVMFLLFQDFYMFSPSYWNYVRNGVLVEELSKKLTGENIVFDMIDDDSVFRYSGNLLTENVTVQGSHSSPQYYWSVANEHIADYRTQLGFSDPNLHHYRDYGERFIQNALSGVKYFTSDDEDFVPYGFEHLGKIKGYEVYYSDYALPLLYAYDGCIPSSVWNRLDAVQKNEVLVQAGMVEEELEDLSQTSPVFETVDIEYELILSNTLSITSNSIEVKGQEAEAYLDVHTGNSGEYFLVIEGLNTEKETANIEVTCNDMSKWILFKGTGNHYYMDRHDYLVDLGYMEGLDGQIVLDFSNGDNYSYDAIRVVCQPLGYQIACLEKLKGTDLGNLEIGTNTIKANVTVSDSSLLCIAIPYSEGWKAWVDGEPAELFNCNIQYIGLDLPSGEHEIVLKYATPLLKEGTLISTFSIVAYAFLLARDLRKKEDRYE